MTFIGDLACNFIGITFIIVYANGIILIDAGASGRRLNCSELHHTLTRLGHISTLAITELSNRLLLSHLGEGRHCLVLFWGHYITAHLVRNAEQKLDFNLFVTLVQEGLKENSCFQCPIELAEETSVGKHDFIVGDVETEGVTHVLLCLLEVLLSQVELSEGPHQQRVPFLLLLKLNKVFFSLGRSLSQELLLVSHSFVSVLGWLTGLFLDQMITFTICLHFRCGNHKVKLISLSLDHLLDGLFHLLDKVYVQLWVELVTSVLLESFECTSLLEMFADDSDDCLLHLFFQNVVLALGVNLIKEFFLTLFICLISLFLTSWDLRLGFQISLEHLVVLSSQSFHCNSDLLPKVIVTVFAEGPHDQLLDWQHIWRLGLRLSGL